MNYRHILTVLFLFVFGFVPTSVLAQSADVEIIEDFHSDITVNADASVNVTETIQVNALGEQIQHGIYRDFPTVYKDDKGLTHRVGFRVQNITRDGQTEPYHTESQLNGQRVYIGDANKLLPPGVYTYALTYQTDRQLGFFSDHDELYWNVTGNGWVFPILKASATVTLPAKIEAAKIQTAGYTGLAGSREQNFEELIDTEGRINFQTTTTLGTNEGLTIVVGWPKGIVQEPTMSEKNVLFIRDNAGIFVGAAGLIVVFVYYILTWLKVGRDPKRGVIVPLYEPPQNLSPAAMRFVTHEGSDNTAFAAAILALAVKGHLTIEEKTKRKYTLHKITSGQMLSPEEQILLDNIFSTGDTFELIQDNHSRISTIISAVKTALKKDYGQYFRKNYWRTALGMVLSAAFLSATALASIELYTQIVYLPAWLIAFLIINIIFFFLLPQRTAEGRKIMDEIEGFKWFLSVTEKDRLNFHNPPGRTPELFEKFLPYALALKIEQKWAEQFAAEFAKLKEAGRPYAPLWYTGIYLNNFNAGSFASHVAGSMPGVISSASAAPGSSSGFGGGSSGGGGGGGGGGGW